MSREAACLDNPCTFPRLWNLLVTDIFHVPVHCISEVSKCYTHLALDRFLRIFDLEAFLAHILFAAPRKPWDNIHFPFSPVILRSNQTAVSRWSCSIKYSIILSWSLEAQDSLSYRLLLQPLEAHCMIFAVHLGIVRIFLLQNDTHWTLDQSQLGRTHALRTDITVTYHTVAHFIIACRKRFPLNFWRSVAASCDLLTSDFARSSPVVCSAICTNSNCNRAGRAGFQPILFALDSPSVLERRLPSTWLSTCGFPSDHCTKSIQWAASLQQNWTAASFKLASVTDTSMNLVPKPIVILYGPNDRNLPELNRIFF